MRAMAVVGLATVTGCSSGTLVFEDANNYSYESTIAIASVPMQAETEPCFDWSGLTTDIRGRAFDGVVDEAYLTQMAQSQEETIAKFEDNTFFASDVDEPYAVNPAAADTQVCGGSFSVIGNDFSPDTFQDGDDWLITLMEFRDSPAGGLNPLMSLFVTPSASSDVTEVSLSDTSMDLQITGLDIAGAPRLVVSRGTNRADWSAVTTDVYGNPYSNQDGNDLFLARFDVASVDEIEEVFLTLDTSAAEIYRFDAFGLSTLDDLSRAEASDGTAFGGFTDDGIWVFGIGCGECTNPAPLLLGVVEVQ